MNKKAFTLVEIMVAITIFMIVMVSVLQIFGISVNITNKVDITRQMQLNTKNVTETIAEDIRKFGIKWVKQNKTDSYELWDNTNIKSWNFLKIWDIKYYLSLDETNFIPLNKTEMNNKCKDLKNNCFLVRDDNWDKAKLTNSFVAFEDLNFTILGDKIKRIVINFTIRPATKKWVRSSLIEKSKMIFETTLSERFVKTN